MSPTADDWLDMRIDWYEQTRDEHLTDAEADGRAADEWASREPS